jgi:hypothetical protein
MNHNLGGARYRTFMIYYFNRACHMAEDEFRTFQDEWGLHDWRPDYIAQGAGDLGEIKIVPSETYLDYALHWYIKSFEIGRNRAVYWDNMFLRGSYNVQMTGAYREKNGRIVPSTGIWGLRELVKRTHQMMSRRGMEPITMPHMTSTLILPVHGLATITYDLEWKYGQGEMQDRFTDDYLLLVSNGELAGTWPIMLGDKASDDRWLNRTYTAATIVHDIWWPQGAGGGVVLRAAAEMLQRPGFRVYRYWDEGPMPVKTNHPKILWIAVGVPGERFIVVLTSYLQEDRYTRITLDPEVMGFTGGFRVRNWETTGTLVPRDQTVTMRVPKHDAVILEIDAEK